MAGVRPTTVSTNPKRADSAASSRSQASESSKAAVRHRAWAANTVGSGSSSTVWIICSSSVHSSPAACGLRPSKR